MNVIVAWSEIDMSDTIVITNEDGTTMVFDTESSAKKYAEENLNWYWAVAGTPLVKHRRARKGSNRR